MMAVDVGSKVLRGAITIAIVGVLAKFAAFISEAILAAVLGISYKSDAYYMVSSIQQVVYPMLSIGIWKVFLPLYKERVTRGEQAEASRLANATITFFTIVSVICVILLEVFSSSIVHVIAPGFDGYTRDLCIHLVRITAPMYVFILAAAVYASMLQCHDKYFGSQVREVASHVPTIVAALFFYKAYGMEALACALVVGGVIRLLIELPFVDWGYRYQLCFRFNLPEFSLLLNRLPSALISEGIVQINPLVDKSMASRLGEGVIASLNYGNRLTNVFSGLLSMSVTTALYPQMVELIARDNLEGVSRILEKILNLFCLVMVPVTIACMLFREDLVAVAFQRGSFDVRSTSVVSGVFICYCFGLLFVACNGVLNNMFYAFGDPNTPMLVSVANVVLNYVFNIAFMKVWGVNGLALSTSVTAALCFVVRLLLAKRYVSLRLTGFALTSVQVLACSILTCGVAFYAASLASNGHIDKLLIGATVGILLYFPLIRLFRVAALDDLLGLIKRKISSK